MRVFEHLIGVLAVTVVALGASGAEIPKISTVHADGYLLVYTTGSRTLFVADHLRGPYINDAPRANGGSASLDAALEPLNLNFNKIVTAHYSHLYSAKEPNKSVAGVERDLCPDDTVLCLEM